MLLPCIEEYISKNSVYLSLSSASQDVLATCSTQAVVVALKSGQLEVCDNPVDNCAALEPAEGLGISVCGDDYNAGKAIFGTYTKPAPFCIHPCNDGDGFCGAGMCMETSPLQL